MKIVAVGDNCLDVYVEQNQVTVGGNALNVAANAHIAGHESTYIGPVGSDEAGATITGVMASAGLATSDLLTREGVSGITLIELVEKDRRFLFEEFGVCGDWVPQLIPERASQSAMDWIHVGGPRTMDADFRALGAQARLVSIDLSDNVVPSDLDLTGVSVVFVSFDVEKGEATLAIGDRLRSQGANEAVVLSGPQGSTFVGNEGGFFCPAYPAEKYDTCGAGDSYISGFMIARAGGADPERAMDAGTTSATHTIQHLGGFPQEPHPIPEWIRRVYGL